MLGPKEDGADAYLVKQKGHHCANLVGYVRVAHRSPRPHIAGEASAPIAIPKVDEEHARDVVKLAGSETLAAVGDDFAHAMRVRCHLHVLEDVLKHVLSIARVVQIVSEHTVGLWDGRKGPSFELVDLTSAALDTTKSGGRNPSALVVTRSGRRPARVRAWVATR